MSTCPCGSGKDYVDCCEPFLKGRVQAPTAEALMRSRYTAYVRGQIDYIGATHDPRTVKHHDPDQAREWSEGSEWLGLEILSVEGGSPLDARGQVEFIARYRTGDEDLEHREIATFRRDGDTWYFVDGKVIGPDPIRRETPKVGRNDPCPCGSGRKFKKCCGKAGS